MSSDTPGSRRAGESPATGRARKSPATGRANKVYLVGAGPGDPGLLTLRGKRCLAEADVVIYDYLANPRLLRFASPEAERIFCGKHGGGAHILTQEEINALLVERACAGDVVVRLKGGDPFIFGRGGEEAEALRGAGVAFEIVPGVSSVTAVAAYAGIPLTHRDHTSTLTIVSGQGAKTAQSEVPWAQLGHGGTVVLLMSVTQLATNLARLREAGLSPATPAALIRWGTMPAQETIVGTIADLGERVAALRLRPPAVIIVGEVVRLRERLKWFESRPLFGRCVVVTRPRAQASEFVTRLEELGADVIEFPTIEVIPPESCELFDVALRRLRDYQWVVFTSVNGVRAFLERLSAIGADTRHLGNARLAAIGTETARALARAHLRADAVPAEYRAEALPDALGGASLRGQRILLARAAGARSVLPEALRKLGADVDDVVAYRTQIPEVGAGDIRRCLEEGRVDLLTFASSSTVRHFVEIVGASQIAGALRRRGPEGGRRLRVGCIGPVTGQTAADLGLPVDIQPTEYTIPAFTEAIVTYFCNGG